MIFALTEDQQMVREMARRFAAEAVRPSAAAWNDAGTIPPAVFAQLAELGLMAATAPADDGGSELDAVSFALVLEELGREDASLAVTLASHDAALSVSPDQRGRVIANGELAGIAPGSVIAGQGSVSWVARESGGLTPVGDTERLTGFGLEAAALARTTAAGVVPDIWYTWLAAIAVGVARGALEEAVAYANERHQFGKPLVAYQAIQFKLAEMATAVDAGRLMALHAAAGEIAPIVALRVASDAALFVTDEAVQVHGGYGYVREYAVERYYRDARFFPIWVGA